MSKVTGPQWSERRRLKACAVLRLGVALWLIYHLFYTPIHLYGEPHSDGVDLVRTAASAAPLAVRGDGHQDSDGHHERHPAVQHMFKVVKSERLMLGQMLLVPALGRMDAEGDCPQPPVLGFSGLSPPELGRCWQFLFRTALPVRAPSLLA